MSNAIFPTLPGLSWGSTREPIWVTSAKKSLSGMEQRAGYMSYPLYRIKLSYEFLRAGAEAELQMLVGFFNQRGGDLESFLFDDPADNTAVDQQFGIGDGTTTVFRLGRTLGGAYEPVSAVNGTPVIRQAHNYLLYTEQIDNAAWTKNGGTTVAGNQTSAPNGTPTGDRVTSPQDMGVSQLASVESGAVHTVSAYIKSISATSLRFRDTAGAGHHVDINLTSGAISNASNVTASGSINAGGGWWRVWMTYTTDTTSIRITPRPNDAGTTVFDLWGAQVEKSNQLGDYFATTTPNKPASSYTLDPDTALVTYTPAPASGTLLKWSGNYYRRVRFEESSLELKEFLRDLWEAKTLSLLTVKT